MLKTIIIEDEPAIRDEIKWMVNREKDMELQGTAASVEEAVGLIKNNDLQLALMDVQLTDGTAFDVLSQLSEVSFDIIFITAYNHFAIKAIKYGAFDYLLKPLDQEEFQSALERLRTGSANARQPQEQQLEVTQAHARQPEKTLEDQLVLHTMEYLQVLQLKDIRYCKSGGSYTNFFLTDGREIMVSKPLKYYDELLPEKWFLRPHQSYLVNVLYIDRFMKNGSIILKNRTKIPVSIRRKEYVLRRITGR